MKKKILMIAGILGFLIIIGAVLIKMNDAVNGNNGAKSDTKINLVASFYPTYILTLNIAEGVPGLTVTNLTDYSSGCLHDYQITTKDMRTLSDADVFVINGGGMENFIEDTLKSYPGLSIIDASNGIEFLEDELHDHGHASEDRHDKDNVDNDESEDHDIDGIYVNAHVWLNPKLYIQQIENVRDGLINYIEGTNLYKDRELDEIIATINNNADSYIEKVITLDNEISEVVDMNSNKLSKVDDSDQAVIFHDAFAYLADRIGFAVAHTVEMDADTYLSAGEVAGIINIIDENHVKYLFTELQYSDSVAKRIEEETDAKVYIIDSAVTGDGTKNSYLDSMNMNLTVIKNALH